MGGILDLLFGEYDSPNEDRLRRLDDAIETIRVTHTNQLIMWAILTRMERRFATMATNWDEFDADLTTLIEGFEAQKAVIATQNETIANADKSTQNAVDKALAENDAADQEKIDAATEKIRAGISRPESDEDSDVDPNNATTPDVPSSEAPAEIQANGPASDQ